MSSAVLLIGARGPFHKSAGSPDQSCIGHNVCVPGLEPEKEGPFRSHIGSVDRSELSCSSCFVCRRVPRCAGVSWAFRQRQFCGRLNTISCNFKRRHGVRAVLASIAAAVSSEVSSTHLADGEAEEDAFYMRMAVELARKAVGHTSPNPMVGCVIVKDEKVVGQGFHPKAGEPHAEVFALREAGENARGATAYVSLEPCNHTGRTPPCSQALVRAEVKRVVVGTLDPNPLVGGQGVRTLQKAGVEVLVGVEEDLCKATAESFFHRITAKKPFLTLRYMLSLDGTLLRNLDYGNERGQHASLLLEENDAVIINSSCLQENDPILLSEEPGAKQPLRVVLASSISDLPVNRHVFDTTLAPTIVLIDERDLYVDEKSSRSSSELTLRSKHVDVVVVDDLNLDSILNLLHQKGFNSVLLDLRGTEPSGSDSCLGALAVAQSAAQKVVVVISPVLLGNKRSGKDIFGHNGPTRLQRVSTKIDSGHVIIEGYLTAGTSA